MTYTQASRILDSENHFSEREQILAAKKIYKLSCLALHLAVIAECIGRIIASVIRLTLWIGGVFAVMFSFLRLAYNTTAEFETPITETLRLELLLVIGIASAYIGYKLIEKERIKKNGRK